VLAAVTDITERKRSEDRERLARREAERANRLKDEFLAMVSHELRTPLNAILGWADMLQSGTLQDARRDRAIHAIHSNAQRQAQLIGELLDVSRIMSGKLLLGRTAVDLQNAVRTAIEVVQASADAKGIHIAVDADPSVGPFYADATRLQQILWNLLSNAIKFTPDGGAVHVRVWRADGGVELIVTDTGQGIPAAFLPSVFEPFQQADRSTARQHGGLGLGLSIVRHLVEAHGGTITVESAGEGQGSTFILRLPIVAVYADRLDAGPTTQPSPSNPSATDASASLDGLTVLVVDDDEESRELVAATLESRGALVLPAASAADALRVLSSQRVDVLLSDVAMPGEDGYSLIRRVRLLEMAGAPFIPAAALTSFARDEDRQQALQAGFQLHLVKPIDSRALVEAVASLTRIELH
jgi:CheY-like chemotaxis protein